MNIERSTSNVESATWGGHPAARGGAAHALFERLRGLGRRRRSIARLRGALSFLALIGFGLLLVGWLDLLAALPAAVRVGGAIGVAVLALGGAARSLVRARRRSRPMAVARDVDRLCVTGGQTAAGLDLTALEPASAPLTQGLALVAVTRARDIAVGVPTERIEPLRGVVQAGAWLAALFVGTVLLAGLFPRAFRIGFLRLMNPLGDRAPYSRHVFAVEPGNTQAMYGDAVPVRAVVSGVPVERVDLVVRGADGAEQAVPMFEDRDRSWRAQLTEVTAPLTYWVQVPGGRSDRYQVGVIYTPRIESLSVRVTPPAYTNLPPVEGPLPQGGITGLPGTEVRITARSNRPLSRGDLVIQPDRADAALPSGKPPEPALALTAAPVPGERKSVSATFTIERPARLTLSVVDEQGTRSAAAITAPIVVLKDTRPLVRIVAPMARSFATPDVPLSVRVDAEDDYGLVSLSLYRSLNGSRHLPERFQVPIPPARRLKAETTLSLKDYGLCPGDVVTLFARTEDSDPHGPKGAESGMVHITIISREEYEQLVRAQATVADFEAKYRAAARRLERLAALARDLRTAAQAETGDRVTDEMRNRLRDFANALDEAARETQRAADQPPLFALDQDLSQPLKEMAAALARAAQEARRAGRSASPGEMRQALESALQGIAGQQEDYQGAVMRQLERFAAAFSLLEMEQRFVELYQAQEELAQRMANLKGAAADDDPTRRARMRDLKDEQEARAQRLDTILQEIRTRAQALPEHPDLEKLRQTAVKFADAVAASPAGPAMKDASQALEAFQGTAAHQSASEAAAALKAFIKECQGDAGTMAGDTAGACKLAFGPRLEKAAALTLAQMLQAAGMRAGAGGIGSGTGGYSIRSPALSNVGIYGPLTLAAGGGERDHDVSEGSFALESPGGTLEGQIAAGERPDLSAQGMPLHGVPLQHRDRVRAYFRRIAEETSRGVVIEEPAGDERR